MHYLEPTTIEEACRLLSEHEDARCLAGGQTLVAMMNADLVDLDCLISLRRIPNLDQIEMTQPGFITLGAMVTHAQIAREVRFSGSLAVVREAAAVTAHPAVRNMGTIGGTICHADSAADQVTAIVAADAEIDIMGMGGHRTVAASDFFVDYMTTALEEGEIVAAVRLPVPLPGSIGVYEKFSRVDGDFGIVNVAAVVQREGRDIRQVRIALGGCGMTPIRVREAEELLEAEGLGVVAVTEASALLLEACDPIDDVRGSASYRRELVPHLLSRAIDRALSASEQLQ